MFYQQFGFTTHLAKLQVPVIIKLIINYKLINYNYRIRSMSLRFADFPKMISAIIKEGSSVAM